MKHRLNFKFSYVHVISVSTDRTERRGKSHRFFLTEIFDLFSRGFFFNFLRLNKAKIVETNRCNKYQNTERGRFVSLRIIAFPKFMKILSQQENVGHNSKHISFCFITIYCSFFYEITIKTSL